jgi:hypothetical protein
MSSKLSVPLVMGFVDASRKLISCVPVLPAIV